MMHPDDYGFTYSTDADWDRAEAREIGAQHPERAWVCTDRDVWHRNPFYTGPAVRHPEDDHEGDEAPVQAPAPMDWRDWDEIPF